MLSKRSITARPRVPHFLEEKVGSHAGTVHVRVRGEGRRRGGFPLEGKRKGVEVAWGR